MNVESSDYSLINHFPQHPFQENPTPKGIFKYIKGEQRTRDLIPTHKDPIGRGANGKVYVHRDIDKLVIKKSRRTLEQEFNLGLFLNHFHLVKPHALFIKTLKAEGDSDSEKIYKMVMDRVEGESLDFYKANSIYLSNNLLETLLREALDCSLYLFEQNVRWGDLNMGNILITNDNHLRICDFGYWESSVFDLSKLTVWLILGFVDIAEGLLDCSDLLKEFEGNRDARSAFKNSILYPKGFIVADDIEVFFLELNKKVRKLNELELKKLIDEYLQNLLLMLNTKLMQA